MSATIQESADLRQRVEVAKCSLHLEETADIKLGIMQGQLNKLEESIAVEPRPGNTLHSDFCPQIAALQTDIDHLKACLSLKLGDELKDVILGTVRAS